jgi:hypothetical protein
MVGCSPLSGSDYPDATEADAPDRHRRLAQHRSGHRRHGHRAQRPTAISRHRGAFRQHFVHENVDIGKRIPRARRCLCGTDGSAHRHHDGAGGPVGAGKTTLGLQFLSGSSAAEPGLLFGCCEPPERLRLKAEAMGLDFAGAEQRGDLEVLWHPVGEHIMDELAHCLLDAVRMRGVKRLVIGGISGFQQAVLEPERLVRFWGA